MKIVINNCYGGFGLSKAACDFLGIDRGEVYNKYTINDKNRTDPKLVECIEKLGEKANADCNTDLVVIEIPDQIEFGIMDYGGMEIVYEKGHIWVGPDQD